MFSPLLVAAFSQETMAWLVAIVFFVAVVFISMLLVLVKQYKRCPSNRTSRSNFAIHRECIYCNFALGGLVRTRVIILHPSCSK